MTPRFSRHFATFFVPSPSDASLTAIIKVRHQFIITGTLNGRLTFKLSGILDTYSLSIKEKDDIY